MEQQELEAARAAAVDAVAVWLNLFGEFVGEEADRRAQESGKVTDALRYVMEAAANAQLEARSILGEAFDKATDVAEERINEVLNQPTEQEIDAQVEALASDPDTWDLTALEDGGEEAK
jgi:hypothetical protein